MGVTRALSHVAVERVLGRLEVEASRRGVPDDLACLACAATRQRMGSESFRSREQRDRRVSAYFWGVVRKQAFKGPRVPSRATLRLRLVAASVAQDMRASGIPADVIRREVARCYGEDLAAAVVERMQPLAASA